MTRERKTEVRKKRKLRDLNNDQVLENAELKKKAGGSAARSDGSASSSRHGSVFVGGPIGTNE